MTPKKMKFTVEEGALDKALETQKEVPAPAEANTLPARPRGFYAYAPFEYGGVQYAEGEQFIVPASLKRDADFDTFRRIEKLKDGAVGIAFYETLPPISPKGDPQVRRHVLPLKEE